MSSYRRIDKYLTASQLSVTMQDIDLTPQEYGSPIKEQEKDIPGNIWIFASYSS